MRQWRGWRSGSGPAVLRASWFPFDPFIVPSVPWFFFLCFGGASWPNQVLCIWNEQTDLHPEGPPETRLAPSVRPSGGAHAFLCKFLYKICQNFLICICFCFFKFLCETRVTFLSLDVPAVSCARRGSHPHFFLTSCSWGGAVKVFGSTDFDLAHASC